MSLFVKLNQPGSVGFDQLLQPLKGTRFSLRLRFETPFDPVWKGKIVDLFQDQDVVEALAGLGQQKIHINIVMISGRAGASCLLVKQEDIDKDPFMREYHPGEIIIKLSRDLFEAFPDYSKAVIIHEIGHIREFLEYPEEIQFSSLRVVEGGTLANFYYNSFLHALLDCKLMYRQTTFWGQAKWALACAKRQFGDKMTDRYFLLLGVLIRVVPFIATPDFKVIEGEFLQEQAGVGGDRSQLLAAIRLGRRLGTALIFQNPTETTARLIAQKIDQWARSGSQSIEDFERSAII